MFNMPFFILTTFLVSFPVSGRDTLKVTPQTHKKSCLFSSDIKINTYKIYDMINTSQAEETVR